MIFNIIFCNKDDHFKNQSLIYNEQDDSWALAPAYNITYSLNPLINYKRSYRVLSVNGKKDDINFEDIKALAEKYTIKGYRQIISSLCNMGQTWNCTDSCRFSSGIQAKIRYGSNNRDYLNCYRYFCYELFFKNNTLNTGIELKKSC